MTTTSKTNPLDRPVAAGGPILEQYRDENSDVSKELLALVAIAETLPKDELDLIDSNEIIDDELRVVGARFVLPPHLAQAVRERVSSGNYKPASCSPWCTSHVPWPDLPAITHERRVVCGEISINITNSTGLPVEMYDTCVEFNYDWVSGDEIRDFATALNYAADVLGIEPTGTKVVE